MRTRRPAKRLDVAEIREQYNDGRMWSAIGVVVLEPGESAHYELDADDVLVDVKLAPYGEPVLCRLGAAAGGGGGGMWRIPPVGTEVAVLIPAGDLDHDPIIVACLASGAVPAWLDENTLVIVNDSIKIGRAGGTLSPVARKGDTVTTPTADLIAALAGVFVGTGLGGIPGTPTNPTTGVDGSITTGSSDVEST